MLVDSALAAGVRRFVQPTVTFVYPTGRADGNTPIGAVAPHLRSALDAERQVARFTSQGRDGVVLRLGLLYGPGARTQQPNPDYGATLHVADAAAALAAALEAPAGLYNVLDDAPQVSNAAYTAATGWRPSPHPS